MNSGSVSSNTVSLSTEELLLLRVVAYLLGAPASSRLRQKTRSTGSRQDGGAPGQSTSAKETVVIPAHAHASNHSRKQRNL